MVSSPRPRRLDARPNAPRRSRCLSGGPGRTGPRSFRGRRALPNPALSGPLRPVSGIPPRLRPGLSTAATGDLSPRLDRGARISVGNLPGQRTPRMVRSSFRCDPLRMGGGPPRLAHHPCLPLPVLFGTRRTTSDRGGTPPR